jgi:hypothetical protein
VEQVALGVVTVLKERLTVNQVKVAVYTQVLAVLQDKVVHLRMGLAV